jgi:hypothetical protein
MQLCLWLVRGLLWKSWLGWVSAGLGCQKTARDAGPTTAFQTAQVTALGRSGGTRALELFRSSQNLKAYD